MRKSSLNSSVTLSLVFSSTSIAERVGLELFDVSLLLLLVSPALPVAVSRVIAQKAAEVGFPIAKARSSSVIWSRIPRSTAWGSLVEVSSS